MITVGHLNIHNSLDSLDVALGWNVDSLGLDEAGKRRGALLRRAVGYRSFAIPGARTPERSSLATTILVKRDLRTTGGLGMLLSDAAKPDRIAPDRWAYGIGYRKAGTDVFHVEFHNHAAVDNRDMTGRVRKAAEGVTRLSHTLNYVKALGYAGIVTGDLNTRDSAKSVGWKDAGEMFRSLNYRYVDVGIDWIAWDPSVLVLADVIEHPRLVTKSDHPGIEAFFKPKRR